MTVCMYRDIHTTTLYYSILPLTHALATLVNGKGASYGAQRWYGYCVEERTRHYQTFTNKTEDYISREQQGGFSIRWPLRSSWNSFSTLGTDGYGVPPKVMISHSRMPYDHLQQTRNIKLNIPVLLTLWRRNYFF